MNRQITPRYLVVVGLSCAGLLLSIIAGFPFLALLISPLVALAIIGAAMHRWPDLEIELDVPQRVVEGDEIELIISAGSRVGIPWLLLDFDLPTDLEPVQGTSRTIITIQPGQLVKVKVPVTATRWGVSTPGRISATARDRLGFFVSSVVHRPRQPIRIHPRDGARHTVLAPSRLRARAGNHRSRTHGDGSDFAEIRPYRRGDPQRSINWRVSARKGENWVTVRHPDRSGDLVLLLDSFRDLGPLGDRLVQRAVRAALGLAESNLGQHDRVGLLDVGRNIRWYRPRLGRLHQARLIDALLDTQVEPGLRAHDVHQLPLHDLDSGTLIVFISGLIDEDAAQLPIELRSRGHEVVVLECSPDAHLKVKGRNAELAARLWRLQRAAERKAMVERGVAVVEWKPGDPLELPVAALERRPSAFR